MYLRVDYGSIYDFCCWQRKWRAAYDFEKDVGYDDLLNCHDHGPEFCTWAHVTMINTTHTHAFGNVCIPDLFQEKCPPVA